MLNITMFLWSLNMSENAPGARFTNEYNGSLCGRYSQSLARRLPISLPRLPSQLSLPTTMMTSPALPETLGRRVLVLFPQDTALSKVIVLMTILDMFLISLCFSDCKVTSKFQKVQIRDRCNTLAH